MPRTLVTALLTATLLSATAATGFAAGGVAEGEGLEEPAAQREAQQDHLREELHPLQALGRSAARRQSTRLPQVLRV
jgi:hypothetical protein